MNAGEWPWATLEEVAAITAGNPAPQGSEFFENGRHPFVRVQDLGRLNGAAHLGETADLVNERAAASLKLFPKGSVLFTKSGASLLLNQRAILSRDMHVVSHIGVAVPGRRITSEWLYYWLCNVDFADIAHGANMPSLPLSRVKQIRVPVPPLFEQRQRIAEIEKQFSRLDEAVANLKRVKANLKRYTAAVLHAAVAGRLRPGGVAQHLPVGAAMSDLAPGWRLASVNQAGDVLLGRQRAPQFLTGMNTKKYLRVANIKDNAINFDDIESMDFDEKHYEKYRLAPGDILVSEGQSPELLGQSAIFTGHEEPLCFQKTLHRFRARAGITTPEFAQIVFRAHVRSGVFRRIGSITTNIGHLTLEKFRAAPFPLPPFAEQDYIVGEVDRRLSIVSEVEGDVDTNYKRARALRQAVLLKAFRIHRTGE